MSTEMPPALSARAWSEGVVSSCVREVGVSGKFMSERSTVCVEGSTCGDRSCRLYCSCVIVWVLVR